MKITQRLSNIDTIRPLSALELQLATTVFTHNIDYQLHETVLIVTDEEMLKKEAALWFETAKILGLSVKLLVLSEMTHSGEEPPQEIIDLTARTTINFFQTSFSLTHTQAGKKAIESNGRAISLPGADYQLLMKTLHCEYEEIKKLGEKIKKELVANKEITITSSAGTKLTAQIRQNRIYNDCGFFPPGELGNLPAGEVFFAPLLYSTQGKLVIDGSIADDILDKPLIITIVDGIAIKIEGGTAANNLWRKLDAFGEAGRTVAEIGIGTNPAATIVPNLLEAEKAYGTVHVAFGNSSAIGGENDVPIHIDGLISRPKVVVNNRTILQNKKFTLL